MTDPIEAMARYMCASDPDVRMGDAEAVVQQRVNVEWPHYVQQATAALAALRETLVPVGWRYDHNVFGTAFYRERQEMKRLGPDTTETPLYALPEIKP